MRTCRTSPTRRGALPPHGVGAGAHCTGRYAGEKNFVDFEGDHNSRRPKFFHVRTAAGRAGRAGLRRARVPTLKWAGDTCRKARARTRVVQHTTPEASGLPLAQPLARDSMRLRPHAHAQRSPPPHRAAQRTGPFAVWFDLFVCLFVWFGFACRVLFYVGLWVFVCLFVRGLCVFVCLLLETRSLFVLQAARPFARHGALCLQDSAAIFLLNTLQPKALIATTAAPGELRNTTTTRSTQTISMQRQTRQHDLSRSLCGRCNAGAVRTFAPSAALSIVPLRRRRHRPACADHSLHGSWAALATCVAVVPLQHATCNSAPGAVSCLQGTPAQVRCRRCSRVPPRLPPR